MSSKWYFVQFRDDGTVSSSPPGISIVPGTTFIMSAQAKELRGSVYLPINLTDASLIAAIVDSDNKTRIYQTGTPSITPGNISLGKFSLSLPPTLTRVLIPNESHILEIKAVFPSGERRQICYTPILIKPSALVSE